MPKKKGFKIPGVSFSWKRAIGLTAARQKLSRAIGMPTTRAGMKRKLGFYGLGLVSSTLKKQSRATAKGTGRTGGASGLLAIVFFVLALPVAACAGLGALGFFESTPARPVSRAVSTPARRLTTPKPATQQDEPLVMVNSLPSTAAGEPIAEPDATTVDPVDANDTSPDALIRTWRSAGGKFSTEAEFLSLADDKVKLRKADGKEVSVPLSQLSAADREWVAQNGEQR